MVNCLISSATSSVIGKTVTLLFGAKDEEHNEANVLVDVLEKRRPQQA